MILDIRAETWSSFGLRSISAWGRGYEFKDRVTIGIWGLGAGRSLRRAKRALALRSSARNEAKRSDVVPFLPRLIRHNSSEERGWREGCLERLARALPDQWGVRGGRNSSARDSRDRSLDTRRCYL